MSKEHTELMTIVERVFEGCTLVEIGEELGKNKHSVRYMIHKKLSKVDEDLYEKVKKEMHTNKLRKMKSVAHKGGAVNKQKYEEKLAKQEEEGLKICCRCKEKKPLTSFSKSKKRTDGLNVRCNDCNSELYFAKRPPLKLFVRKWDTKEKVLARLQELIELGLTLTEITKTHAYLYQALQQHELNVKKAVTLLGYDYEKLRITHRKPDEQLIAELLNVQQTHGEISYILLRDHYRALEGSLSIRYGSVEQAIKGLGLEEQVTYVRHGRVWTKEHALEYLQALVEKGIPLNYRSMYEYDSGFFSSLQRLFGSYDQALEAVGIDYASIREDSSVPSAMGHAFEKIGLEILERCQFSLKEGKYFKTETGYLLPDAMSEDEKTFIDFKLSSWTLFNSDTMSKYLPHCEELLVIYLRGEEIKKTLPEQVQLIPIQDLLRQYGLTEEYEPKLQEILAKLEEDEKKDISHTL